jgi:N utilization substance protein A
VESLADMTPEQLEAIEGIGPKTVEKISLAVNNYFASLEPVEAAASEGEVPAEAEGVSVEAEAAPEAAEATSEAAVEGEPACEAAVEGEPAAETTTESAAAETSEEHGPEDGSAPKTTE